MALSDSLLARLPLSTSMLYLAVGAAVSPLWLDWTSHRRRHRRPSALEQIAEIVLLLSLFGSGLKMSAGLSDGRWLLPLRLAIVSMLVTVALVAGVGVARARPAARRRDPARRHPRADRPGARLRRAGGQSAATATGCASRSPARPASTTARPFRSCCSASACSGCTTSAASAGAGSRSTCSGPSAPASPSAPSLGTLVGRSCSTCAAPTRKRSGLDNFLALGLIGLAYGVAEPGARLRLPRRVRRRRRLAPLEQHASVGEGRRRRAGRRPQQGEQRGAIARPTSPRRRTPIPTHRTPSRSATDPKHAPAFMAHAVLELQRADRADRRGRRGDRGRHAALGGRVAPRVVGRSWPCCCSSSGRSRCAVGLIGSKTSASQRGLIGWFGIRGIGSLFYLTYAMNHGLDRDLAANLVALVLLGGGRLDRRPRHLGDAADGDLRAHQGDGAKA